MILETLFGLGLQSVTDRVRPNKAWLARRSNELDQGKEQGTWWKPNGVESHKQLFLAKEVIL